jgi:hypothetical protein
LPGTSDADGVDLTADQIAEARSLIDPVVAAADYAGKPLAAANASVALPPDPLVALWRQITVLREWRGDAHVLVLAANRVGPCECNVLHTATARLIARGRLHADGTVTDAGIAGRERIEVETDEHCADLWAPISTQGTRHLAALTAPIHDAFAAAGTFDQLR